MITPCLALVLCTISIYSDNLLGEDRTLGSCVGLEIGSGEDVELSGMEGGHGRAER